jgi:hypothetical protein
MWQRGRSGLEMPDARDRVGYVRKCRLSHTTRLRFLHMFGRLDTLLTAPHLTGALPPQDIPPPWTQAITSKLVALAPCCSTTGPRKCQVPGATADPRIPHRQRNACQTCQRPRRNKLRLGLGTTIYAWRFSTRTPWLSNSGIGGSRCSRVTGDLPLTSAWWGAVDQPYCSERCSMRGADCADRYAGRMTVASGTLVSVRENGW